MPPAIPGFRSGRQSVGWLATGNAIWQADHTMLDLLILDAAGKPVRPWLTTVVDDHSRAVAGAMAFIGAPSILNTSLALRQAIWRKADPSWPVCGIPDVLYVEYVPRHIFDNMCPSPLCGAAALSVC